VNVATIIIIIIIIIQGVHYEQTNNKLHKKNSAVRISYGETVQSAEIISLISDR